MSWRGVTWLQVLKSEDLTPMTAVMKQRLKTRRTASRQALGARVIVVVLEGPKCRMAQQSATTISLIGDFKTIELQSDYLIYVLKLNYFDHS